MDVAVGILDKNKRVLTAWRGRDKHAGGAWEFPGGKIENGESIEAALQREFKEEIGIEAEIGLPLISLQYRYPDREVSINAYYVRTATELIFANEGQFLRWYPIEKLNANDFPAANLSLINALKLPKQYAITSDCTGKALLHSVEQILSTKAKLLLLRAPSAQNYRAVAEQVAAMVKPTGAGLMLHNHSEDIEALGAVGTHFGQNMLKRIKSRPISRRYWFSVSCHNLSEVLEAEDKGADFCVLGPVSDTPGNKQAPMGLKRFGQIVAKASIPVFALGGMNLSDLTEVRCCGGQGVAGIRCFSSESAGV